MKQHLIARMPPNYKKLCIVMRFNINLSPRGRYSSCGTKPLHFSYDELFARQFQLKEQQELPLPSLKMKKSTMKGFFRAIRSIEGYQSTKRTAYHDQKFRLFSTNPKGSKITTGNDAPTSSTSAINSYAKQAKKRKHKKEEPKTKPVSSDWLNNYHKLVEYQQVYGHCHVFKNEESKISVENNNENGKNHNIMREWLQEQRRLYRKKKLSPHQIDALQSIPTFSWNTNDARWHAQFVQYQKYQQMLCRNTKLTPKPLPPPPLRAWMYTQSLFYRKQMLADEKVELLQKADFPFKTTSHSHKKHSWDYYFNRLKDSITKLSQSNQKENDKFEHTAEVAKRRRQRHHQNMPVLLLHHENKIIDENLLRWIVRQRMAKKVWNPATSKASKKYDNELTQERIDKLNSINFVWDVYEETWNARIAELKDYLTGQDNYLNDIDGTKKSTKVMSPMLSKWIATVRRDFGRYKKDESYDHKNQATLTKKQNSATNILNPQRIRQLEDLNFIWDMRNAQWERQYQLVKHYYEFIYQEEEKHPTMPRQKISSLASKTIFSWVCRQRKEYKMLKDNNKYSLFVLYTSRLQKLILIDFIWDEKDRLWNETLYQLVQYKILHGCWPSSIRNRKVKKYNSSVSQRLTKQQRQQERMLTIFTTDANNLLNNNSVKEGHKNYYRVEALMEVGFPY